MGFIELKDLIQRKILTHVYIMTKAEQIFGRGDAKTFSIIREALLPDITFYNEENDGNNS